MGRIARSNKNLTFILSLTGELCETIPTPDS